MSIWLKYTILYSDFQPNTEKYETIYLDLVPPGSFIQNIKVRANDNFTGPGITGASVTANFQSSVFSANHTLDVFLHPYTIPVPPIPQSRTILLPNTSKQLMKVDLKTLGAPINSLSSGACDIYFQMNTIVYPFTLDLIFKQPTLCFSLKHLLSAFSGNVLHLRRDSDNTFDVFNYVNGLIDNASIITWLAGATAFTRRYYDSSPTNEQLRIATVSRQPIYNPVNNKFTFDGIDDLLLLLAHHSSNDFTLFLRNTEDTGVIVGDSLIQNTHIITRTADTRFRKNPALFTFIAPHNGFKTTILMSNDSTTSLFVDLIEASNSPTVMDVGNFNWDLLGSTAGGFYFLGEWNSLIYYQSALSKSELLILNST